MKIGKRGLVLAMEEEALIDATPAEVTAVEPEIVPAEVEQEVAETVVEGGEAEDLNAAIEEAVEDVTDLEDVGDTMEETVEEGGEGVSPEAAEIAEIAVESLARRLGIRSAKPLPALESFGSTNSRVSATRIAVENIGEMVVKAWEAIKTAFKSLWAKVAAFIDRIFNVNTRLKASAEAALKRVGELKDKKAAAADFESANIARAFNMNGKASGQTAVAILANQTLWTSTLYEIATGLEGALTSIGGVIESAKLAKGADNKDVKQEIIGAIRQGIYSGGAKAKEVVKGSGETVKATEALAFNHVFAIVVQEGSEANTGFVTLQESQGTSKEADKKVPTLSAEEMKKVLEGVIGLVAENDKLKAKKDFVTKFQASADKLIGKAIAAAGKLDGGDETTEYLKHAMNYARRGTSDIGNTYGKLATKVPGLSVQAAKAGLNYVDASLKQYKDGGAKAADDKAAKAE